MEKFIKGMLLFCPTCNNLLLLQQNLHTALQEFYCQSCPYACPVQKNYSNRNKLERKAVDDVLGGADAWDNVDSTEGIFFKSR